MLAKLLHLMDDILALPLTEGVIFATLALQGHPVDTTYNGDSCHTLVDAIDELFFSLPENLADSVDLVVNQTPIVVEAKDTFDPLNVTDMNSFGNLHIS